MDELRKMLPDEVIDTLYGARTPEPEEIDKEIVEHAASIARIQTTEGFQYIIQFLDELIEKKKRDPESYYAHKDLLSLDVGARFAILQIKTHIQELLSIANDEHYEQEQPENIGNTADTSA